MEDCWGEFFVGPEILIVSARCSALWRDTRSVEGSYQTYLVVSEFEFMSVRAIIKLLRPCSVLGSGCNWDMMFRL